jgi:glycerol kinase
VKGRHVLAIDQGTSGTKAVIFDSTGRMSARAGADLASRFPRPGFVEQDPDEIYLNVLAALKDCVARFQAAGEDPLTIECCGISNQRETFLLWDSGGRPLTPAVVWQCKRSVEICARLRSTGTEEEVKKRTGLVIDPYFSGTKLVWLAENDPGVREAIASGAARFGTVDTWLLYRLTGGRVFATDHTNASRTLLFNIDTLTWDPWLLDAFHLRGLNLPSVHPAAWRFGESDFEGRLPRPIPITAMIGDSQAAAFGEGCHSAGTAKATMGTGSSILMNVGQHRVDSRSGMVSTICWSTRERVDYALEGIIVTAGATIRWLRDSLGLFAESGATEAMAQSVPDSGGVHLVPAFSGMGAPWWRMDLRAAITGLTFGSSRNHIVRAALESISFQIADVCAAMESDGALKLTQLRVDGGITANGFVMQHLADVLSAEVVNIGLEEVSALGAACLAGLEAGIFGGISQLQGLQREPRRFIPGPHSAAAKKGHEEWKETVRKLL